MAKPPIYSFWSLVDRKSYHPKGCWLWTGKVNRSGYGYFTIFGRKMYAHRVAYTIVKGQIRRGWEIDHRCTTRLCCNPRHLEQVTPSENKRRITDRKPHQGI